MAFERLPRNRLQLPDSGGSQHDFLDGREQRGLRAWYVHIVNSTATATSVAGDGNRKIWPRVLALLLSNIRSLNKIRRAPVEWPTQ